MLSKIEVEKIKQFVRDEGMVQAVKKVMLEPIYEQGVLREGENPDPLKNFVLRIEDSKQSNEKIGEQLRGKVVAISLLMQGFNELATYLPTKTRKVDKTNKAL